MKFKCIYFNWKLITLHYWIGFTIHWQESANGVYVFPILIPSHLPSHAIPLGHPVYQPREPSIMHRIWTGNLLHIWYFTCFNAILPHHQTLALSHKVQKTGLYIGVSLAVSHTGLSLPSFWIPYICISVLYCCFSFWFTSLCIIGSVSCN